MKFSPDLFKVVDHCQYRSFITNKYTGARIAVDCGQCDYCIYKKAKKASMRVKTAGSSFKYSYFVTLTYDNTHLPLMDCKVLHSDYVDALGISGDIHFGDEHHQYIPVSEYNCDDNSMLRHIFFEQVQGTVPFDREIMSLSSFFKMMKEFCVSTSLNTGYSSALKHFIISSLSRYLMISFAGSVPSSSTCSSSIFFA